MKRIALIAVAASLVSNASFASGVTYLSCDLPARDEVPVTHFDFTLDEQNSTVSFFVKQANVVNKETASFGPDSITWTNNMSYGQITRTISRVDLSFVQDTDIAGIKTHEVGQCKIAHPAKRQF